MMRILSTSRKFSAGWPLLPAYNFLATVTSTSVTYRLVAVASLRFLSTENIPWIIVKLCIVDWAVCSKRLTWQSCRIIVTCLVIIYYWITAIFCWPGCLYCSLAVAAEWISCKPLLLLWHAVDVQGGPTVVIHNIIRYSAGGLLLHLIVAAASASWGDRQFLCCTSIWAHHVAAVNHIRVLLLVTMECIDKIHWFLSHINYIKHKCCDHWRAVQCISLQHDHLLQLISALNFPGMVDLLLHGSPLA